MRIPLVEDEEEIAEAVRRGLAKAGYAVEATASGEEGLALALDGTFGLLILDVMLPDMDGCTVCERLRRAGTIRARALRLVLENFRREGRRSSRRLPTARTGSLPSTIRIADFPRPVTKTDSFCLKNEQSGPAGS